MAPEKRISRKEAQELLAGTTAVRLPLPMAYSDPAFLKCLNEAAGSQELIDNFDRLCKASVGRIITGSTIEKMVDIATGFQDEQLRRFAEFVHDAVYMRCTDEMIHALRLSALEADSED